MDLYFPDRPGHKSANQLIDLMIDDAELYYAASTMTDVFFLSKTTQKKLLKDDGIELTDTMSAAANEIAWGCIKNMYEIASPIPTSIPVLFLSTKMKDIHNDFEDDVLLASAQTADIDYLITNDKTLLIKSTVQALSCEDFLKMAASEIEL